MSEEAFVEIPLAKAQELRTRIRELEAENARLRTVGQKLRDISREATNFRHGSRVTVRDAEAAEGEWDALIRGEEPSR